MLFEDSLPVLLFIGGGVMGLIIGFCLGLIAAQER
jgi:hypothetical protein